MPSQLFAVAALLLGSAFLLIAGGIHGLLLPVRGAIEGFSVTQLGLLGTSWAIGFITGCLLMPLVVRRVGHARSYGALASVAAVTILLNLLVISPLMWIPLRAITGFCFAGAAMVVESWLNERASRENRGTIFAVYQMVNYAANTAGQLVLVLTVPTGYFYFVLGAIFYCLAILPTALSTAASPRPLAATRLDVARLYRISPVGAVVCFLIGLVNGAFGTLGPVYAQQIGLPIRSIAILTAGALLGGSLIQFPLGWLSDRIDRRRVLVGVAIGAAAIGIVMVAFQPHAPAIVTPLAILFGAMIYPMYALTVAHANDYAGPDEFVKIAGTILLLYGVGTMLGPLAAAYAMQKFEPEGLFAFTASVDVVAATYVLVRMSQRSPLGRVLRNPFRGMPVAKTVTPESAVLDPRSDEGRDVALSPEPIDSEPTVAPAKE